MDTHITDYFKSLFSSAGQDGSMDFLELLRGRIKTNMSNGLSRVFSHGELYSTLQQMHPTKALGPDGMPPLILPKILTYCGQFSD